MGKQWKYLTEQEFETIKQLQILKLRPSQIARIVERSDATIAKVMKHDTLADHRAAIKAEKAISDARIAARLEAAKQPVPELTVEEAVEAAFGKQYPVPPSPVQQKAEQAFAADEPDSQLIVSLTRIAIAIEHLADVWDNGAANKRKLFNR